MLHWANVDLLGYTSAEDILPGIEITEGALLDL